MLFALQFAISNHLVILVTAQKARNRVLGHNTADVVIDAAVKIEKRLEGVGAWRVDDNGPLRGGDLDGACREGQILGCTGHNRER